MTLNEVGELLTQLEVSLFKLHLVSQNGKLFKLYTESKYIVDEDYEFCDELYKYWRDRI